MAAEELVERGAKADAGDPAIRRAIAAALARLVDLAQSFVAEPAFGPAWFTAVPDDRVFPRPHSPLFDFEKTRDGAEWIERIARVARSERERAAGARVVGHFDWRAEHLRFEHAEVVASYDWDSLHAELEPVLVGATAHAFTADWSDEARARFPTIEEARGFLDDFEVARDHTFIPAERRTASCSWVYSTAYTALRPRARPHARARDRRCPSPAAGARRARAARRALM
jgi:hypothetical protein